MAKEPTKRTEYNKAWQEKNKDYSNYLKGRSHARSFIRKRSTIDDLNELEKIIADRRIELSNAPKD